MSLLQSVFLGAVQGITEFLPVSSSGHLAILKKVFSIDTGGSILFDVLLHFGTLIVIMIVFRKDVFRLFRSFFGIVSDLFTNLSLRKANRNAISVTPYKCIISDNYRKYLMLLITSTIPTAVIGLIGQKLIGDASDTLIVPGICLLFTGLMLLFADSVPENDKIPKDITYREALIIGIAQGIATLPGISRSGATICACLLCGFNRRFAVRYSFILSIPVVLGGALLSLKDVTFSALAVSDVMIVLAGIVTAALVGFACIHTMPLIVRKRKFKYFAYYCFAVGAIAVAIYFLM